MTLKAHASPGARILLLGLAALLVVVVGSREASAEGEAIKVVSTSVVSEFPEGIRFRVEVEGESEITQVAVRFRIGQRTRGAFDYLSFEEGTLVDSELFWRTNSLPRYIPPGTIITYSFEIEDVDGNEFATEPAEFIYYDIRFEWKEVSDGPVIVAYHGPVKTRAGIILDAITQTLGHMGPLLGALAGLGAKAVSENGDGHLPARVSGLWRGGTVRVDGSTSQYTSSLLLNAQNQDVRVAALGDALALVALTTGRGRAPAVDGLGQVHG